MSQQPSSDQRFLRNLWRFLIGVVVLFIVLGLGVYYALHGDAGLGYIALFFVVVFGFPAGVLVAFLARGRGGRGGGA